MSEGTFLRLTHTGAIPSSLYLSDINAIPRESRPLRAGPVYLPFGGSVDLHHTSDVASSLEVGSIKGFLDQGFLTAEIQLGALAAATIGAGNGVTPEQEARIDTIAFGQTSLEYPLGIGSRNTHAIAGFANGMSSISFQASGDGEWWWTSTPLPGYTGGDAVMRFP